METGNHLDSNNGKMSDVVSLLSSRFPSAYM